MSKDDLEIIPILEDVVVAGDLDKAVTSDIDAKDLESIESFDAALDDTNENDNEETIESDRLPFSDDDLTADALMDETISSESVEEPEMTDEIEESEITNEDEYPTEPSESFESLITEYENSEDVPDEDVTNEDVTNENITPDHGLINEVIEAGEYNLEIHNQTLDTAESEAASDIENDEGGSENSTYDDYEQQETQIDVNQLTENVMQDIMPALETQIRSLVLTSLEKHLSRSVSSQENEVNTDDDEDL